MNILVTGGAGFIGSHACVELLNSGYDIVVVDNLSNSCDISLERVKEITGKDLKFYKVDLLDEDSLDNVFSQEHINTVIHFAGLKSPNESINKPLEYYNNNIIGTLNLCACMKKHGVKNIIFSSSATVYGEPAVLPITEECPKGMPINPYGMTKWMIEEILKDIYISDKTWNVIVLRYFNPIGAHESGLIGEDPKGIPNNLLPYITQVAIGKREYLKIYGNDYDTPDGTCIRDYIHVSDLAQAHVLGAKYILENNKSILLNLGSNEGYSVKEIINEVSKYGSVNYEIGPRREGDPAKLIASNERAKEILGWSPKHNLASIIESDIKYRTKISKID